MRCQPGSTAFISSAQLYNALTDEEKKAADRSFWEPAPYPFAWSGTRKCRSNGLGLAPGGKTIPPDELPDWTSDKVFKYPMVWLNPVSGGNVSKSWPKLYAKSTLRMHHIKMRRLWKMRGKYVFGSIRFSIASPDLNIS